MSQTTSWHMLLKILFSFVTLAVAEVGDTAVAGANTPATQVHRRIIIAEWIELRANRKWYGKIPGLDRKYDERRHSNGLPYHLHVPAGHVIDDFVYFTPGFMDWLFAQGRNVH